MTHPVARKRAIRIVAVGLIPLMLASCARSPATGERIFTGGMSRQDERKIGAEQHPKLVRQFGGEFDDEDINGYVQDLGQKLAKRSEMPGLEWDFTVIDSGMVNAFALPGGYIHVTRGLVSLAENEAELAGVLGHEIGHVTARHSAERYGSSVLANIAGLAGAIFLGRQAANAIGTLSSVALRGYSRSQELEADTLGVRYLRRMNYAPEAMATFLEKMRANSRLQAVLRGLPPDTADQFDIMQTHPRTEKRVKQAIAAARDGRPDGKIGRAAFLSKLSGMRYGGGPKQGFVRQEKFLHPELRFAFEVPSGFRLFNRPNQVVARGPEAARIVFDMARTERPLTATTYLTRVWAKDARLSRVTRFEAHGKRAATGRTRVRTRDGVRDLRVVAVRWDRTRFYRFMFVTAPAQTERFDRAFQRTARSLRPLSAEEAASLKPLRLNVHTVREGETVADLAARLPFADYKERRFRVLNGLDEGETVAPGDRVKLVVEGG